MQTRLTNNRSEEKTNSHLQKLKSLLSKCVLKPKVEMSFDEWERLESAPRMKSNYKNHNNYRPF